MTYTRYLLCGLIGTAFLLSAGCNHKKDDPEPPVARRYEEWQSSEVFRTQENNAVLSAMVVTDIHFVPNRPQLNSLGRGRLLAIAEHLETYGGEVVVDSRQVDPITREERFEEVRRYLLIVGRLDSDRLEIRPGLGNGRGMDANEATLFYAQNLMPDESAAVAGAAPAADPSDASGGGTQ